MNAPRFVGGTDAWRHVAGLLGGKAANLGYLTHAGLPVPPWYCATTELYREVTAPLAHRMDGLLNGLSLSDPTRIESSSRLIREAIESATLSTQARAELLAGFDGISQTDGLVSVRSSALGEDGGRDSFAGQLDSYLCVLREDVPAQLLACFASAYSARSLAYRLRRDLPLTGIECAVVVQAMFDSHASGVLFTRDPVGRHPGCAVVVAGLGLGEGVVGEKVETDRFVLSRVDGRVLERETPAKRAAVRLAEAGNGTEVMAVGGLDPEAASVSDSTLRALLQVALTIESDRGAPQDVEWAVDGAGNLAILQTRPVTALPDSHVSIFDNSNIVENYPGLTRPLTFSFARHGYEISFQEALRRTGVPDTVLQAERTGLSNLISLVAGRMYYDIGNWYRLFATAGLEGGLSAWESAMGIEGARPDVPVLSGIARTVRQTRTAVHLAWRFARLDSGVARFRSDYERAKEAVEKALYEAPGAHGLIETYESSLEPLFKGYAISVLNDFYAQQLFASLGRRLEPLLGSKTAEMRSRLIAGEPGVESLEPLHSAAALATEIRADAALRGWFDSNRTDAALWTALNSDPRHAGFCGRVQKHLAQYAERTVQELKLESPTLADDPAAFLATLRNLARNGLSPAELTRSEQKRRGDAEKSLTGALAGHPIQAAVVRWILRHTRRTIRNRENLRLMRARGFGLARKLFRAIGAEFAGKGLLATAEDVTYLAVDEIRGAIRGHSATRNLAALVALRRAEYADFAYKSPPARFVVRGIASAAVIPVLATENPGAGGNGLVAGATLTGTGTSPGRATARARVVCQPDLSLRVDCEILVAPMTDPGWVYLMAAASGLVSERGSMLSHTAIVGRELGIPTVVGVAGATTSIADGDMIELDGDAGTVRFTRTLAEAA